MKKGSPIETRLEPADWEIIIFGPIARPMKHRLSGHKWLVHYEILTNGRRRKHGHMTFAAIPSEYEMPVIARRILKELNPTIEEGRKPLPVLDGEEPLARPWEADSIGTCAGCSLPDVSVGASGLCEICYGEAEGRRVSEARERAILQSRATVKICRGCGLVFLFVPFRISDALIVEEKAEQALQGLEYLPTFSSRVHTALTQCPECGSDLEEKEGVEWAELSRIAEGMKRKKEFR